jgi:predicted deacylase
MHGKHEGPTAWINAAIHGDEVDGVEIIRRVLAEIDPGSLNGTLLAVPVVNGHGFMSGVRYLPDRRDLNRAFPGSERGPLASRIAHLFSREVVARCTVGIDLHTGSDHRTNLPQIRADLDDPTTRHLAQAFGAPVMLHSRTRDGSLRQSAADAGATVLLFEGGEAWRFDESSISTATSGVLRVLNEIGMLNQQLHGRVEPPASIECRSSRWVRVRRSGIAQIWSGVGEIVTKGQVLGRVHDAFGRRLAVVKANTDGIVIGLNLSPIVNQGDAVIHIAQPKEYLD